MSKLILISAGHSEKDPGAVGNGFKEAKIAVQFRDKTAEYLRAKGLSVLEDGADGINDSLDKAIVLAKKSDIAIEFHLNASTNASANGIECLALPKNRTLAQLISIAIQSVTNGRLRGESGFLDQSKGQHHRLGFCMAGGIIVELCFISNKTELETLLANKDAVCRAIADIIAAQAGVKTTAQAKYTVLPGDNLTKISAKTGVPVSEIWRLNSLKTDVLQPNQELVIR